MAESRGGGWGWCLFVKVVVPHVVDSRSARGAISQPPESRHGCDDYPANRQNYPERYLYEPLLAARKHPRSRKPTVAVGRLLCAQPTHS